MTCRQLVLASTSPFRRELLNRLLDLSDAQLEHLRAQGVLTLPG